MKKLSFGMLLLALIFLGCEDKKKVEELTNSVNELRQKLEAAESAAAASQESVKRLEFLAAKMKDVKARIVTNFGDIELKFYPQQAPIHCFNFITRAESGFYDNSQFHRVIPGFMIQGGDPNSKDSDPYNDGSGGPLVMIPHEFNDLKHKRGILSTARVGDVTVGAGCQFFIMHGEAPHLDRQYTVFGEVTKGLEIVDKIATLETSTDPRLPNHPVKAAIIKKVEVFR